MDEQTGDLLKARELKDEIASLLTCAGPLDDLKILQTMRATAQTDDLDRLAAILSMVKLEVNWSQEHVTLD